MENVAGTDKSQRVLGLAPAPTMPLVAPTAAGQPPIAGGVLVYRCVLAAGSGGLFSEKEIEEFFDDHFKARERGLVATLLNRDAPEAQQKLLALFGRPIPIGLIINLWIEIFFFS